MTVQQTTRPTARGRRPGRVPLYAFSVFLVLHGIAHFAGVAGHLERIDEGAAEEYLGGAWSISDPSALRVLAVIWALAGLAFVAAAAVVATRRPPARAVLGVVTSFSLALTVLALWAAVIGVVVNVVLLAVIVAAPARLFPTSARLDRARTGQ